MSEPILLKEGDVIELAIGHTVYVVLPYHFIYENAFGCFTETSQTEVTIGESRKGLDTSFLAGRYIVVKTEFTGGGTAMGNDRYDDGHKVTCQRSLPVAKVLERSLCAEHPLRVSFYQTGSFTAMIADIRPIARARADWREMEIAP